MHHWFTRGRKCKGDLVKQKNVLLAANTFAFFICFSAWVHSGILLTALVRHHLFNWDSVQMGWLLAVPVLTGSLLRLPFGFWAVRYGGNLVFTILMMISSMALFLVSLANNFTDFLLTGFLLGTAGASFAVGVVNIAPLFDKKNQGTALGIFGAGNLGATLTALGAPLLLNYLLQIDSSLSNWRWIPRIYALLLLLTALSFYLFTRQISTRRESPPSFKKMGQVLSNLRVWRFGFYYFALFGGFIAFCQWLPAYVVNSYNVSLQNGGAIAGLFSLAGGLIRPFGGFLSDRLGARSVLYGVFTIVLGLSLFLSFPFIPLPFFAFLLLITGFFLGIGMAAVFKHIPVYFPDDVGIVGGLVGVIGGLGGFFLPILFGWILKISGSWTTCWMIFGGLILVNFIWMHRVVLDLRQNKKEALASWSQ